MAARKQRQRGNREVFSFPQAKKKIVSAVEFSTAPAEHYITLKFQDKTALDFHICLDQPRFRLEADYSDWKTENRRAMKRWPPMRSVAFNT
jgi:hypothetical protein